MGDSLQISNFLGLTGGSRIQGVRPVPTEYTGGVTQSGQSPEVNLESKCGTSNQAEKLPGRGTTYVARNLDFLS
ncbi:MAG: hypothetical protein ACI4S3_06335 [Candidatus Gastranaerophilaceae bacterium]